MKNSLSLNRGNFRRCIPSFYLSGNLCDWTNRHNHPTTSRNFRNW